MFFCLNSETNSEDPPHTHTEGAQSHLNMVWGVGWSKHHSTGANRAHGKEAWGDRRLLCQGLLFVAEKLSKHSNLRKSFSPLHRRVSGRWGWGGGAHSKTLRWSWEGGSTGSSPIHYEHSSGLSISLCVPSSISHVLKKNLFFKWKNQLRLVVFPHFLAPEPL